MKVIELNSASIYERIMNADSKKREDIYRYELMKPFEKKWACYQIPIKAKNPGGYDVIMASQMLGVLDPKVIDESYKSQILLLQQKEFWKSCTESITRSLSEFERKGIALKVSEYLYTVLLADPNSVYSKLSDGYCGDGGIPGYILGFLVPSKETMRKLPAALAHECNHNVRYQYITWSNDVTLAEMMVTEGLAENYAVSLYGEEYLGPWVSKVSKEELQSYIKPIIKEGLGAKGLDNITAYLYGDETAVERGYIPVGLPYCAGYACGYHMIRQYLKKTGDDIARASIRPAEEILAQIEDFWEEEQ